MRATRFIKSKGVEQCGNLSANYVHLIPFNVHNLVKQMWKNQFCYCRINSSSISSYLMESILPSRSSIFPVAEEENWPRSIMSHCYPHSESWRCFILLPPDSELIHRPPEVTAVSLLHATAWFWAASWRLFIRQNLWTLLLKQVYKGRPSVWPGSDFEMSLVLSRDAIQGNNHLRLQKALKVVLCFDCGKKYNLLYWAILNCTCLVWLS